MTALKRRSYVVEVGGRPAERDRVGDAAGLAHVDLSDADPADLDLDLGPLELLGGDPFVLDLLDLALDRGLEIGDRVAPFGVAETVKNPA